MAAPHHSRGNAITERVIQTLQEKLSLITNHVCSALSWESALPNVILSVNSKWHKATGFSPFELLFGRQPPLIRKDFAARITCYDLHARAIQSSMQVMHAQAIAADADAKAAAESRFDSEHREVNFEVGDLVLSRMRDRSSKLGFVSNKFEGPYKILVKEKDIYLLENVNSGQTRKRHISWLKKYREMPQLLNVAAGFIGVLSPAMAILFQTTSPIVWTLSSKYVSLGTENLLYDLAVVSPCEILSKFKNRRIDQLRQLQSQQFAALQKANLIPHGIKPLLVQPQQTQMQPVPQPIVPQPATPDDDDEEEPI